MDCEVVTWQRTQSGFLRTKELKLKRNQITDEGVERLSTALTNTNCKLNSLNLSDNSITQKGKSLVNSMNINRKFCSKSFLQCKCFPVEGILDFDLLVNNFQSLGCFEIAKLLPGNEHNQGFCELKRLHLAFNQITD